MTTKKITPKKRTPDPIVVLEEWGKNQEYRHRLVYDARTNKIYTMGFMWTEPWFKCAEPHVDEMPV